MDEEKSSIRRVETEKELTYEDLKRLKLANFLKPIKEQDPTVDEKIREYVIKIEKTKEAQRPKIKTEDDPEALKKVEEENKVL
jgi:hypothetical protein